MSKCRYCGRNSKSKEDMRREILERIGSKSKEEFGYGNFSSEEMRELHEWVMGIK